MPTREDIEMESEVESMNTDLDFLLRLSNPTDPAHVQSNNLNTIRPFLRLEQWTFKIPVHVPVIHYECHGCQCELKLRD